ncbi:MAG: A/G-specific adenine glycosylase [Oscillospiraceae bacterium]|nr:A/G-specific adenine glycosylase [Oscillospiraceae bacterium]
MLTELPTLLLPWYEANKRDLPWRRDREPYHVWLSEIMLQQTRVEAVRGFYSRFLQALPTVEALAEAEEDLLLKLWEGLGYYSRVRNLQKAARQIVELGAFPTTRKELLQLKGIGPYTSAAIASICFEEGTPAVDGNVIRVLSRVLGRTVEQKEAEAILAPVYPTGRCGEFTQALMELGAVVCVPNGAPDCEACPLKQMCKALAEGQPRAYPVKKAKKERTVEARTVFILRCEDKLAVCKRPDKGLLAGLWQLPDRVGDLSLQQGQDYLKALGVEVTAPVMELRRRHIFTHVQWELRGLYFQCRECSEGLIWVSPEDLKEKIGLPTAYRQFLDIV